MNRQALEEKFKETDVYPVITPGFCNGRSPLVILEAVLDGGAKIVQLRDKELPERYAADFRQMTRRYDALFIMNDSVDLAVTFGADGVHLGEDDLPVAEARQKLPDLLIGASVRDLDQAL
ncbi:MAG: thiamine phosphate synthase, partial [Candidatus Saganbacteria bacterium]|nr:thiamine phosphate synthase [Candidatus Saganbacteria bacterium]